MRRSWILAILFWMGIAGTFAAAAPPGRINYQGVLRDSTGNLLGGIFDMVFRFYDTGGGAPCVGGTLLLTDSHEAAGSGALTLINGLFNVQLGTGVITAGSEASIAEVFRDHATVFMEVAIDDGAGPEALCPRIPVVSTAYALNADHLDGLSSEQFLPTAGGAMTGILEVATGPAPARISNSGIERDSPFNDEVFFIDNGAGDPPSHTMTLTLNGGDANPGAGGVDLGVGLNDDLTAGDVTMLTGGGAADALHTHAAVADAGTLDGNDSSFFLDTSAATQTKGGTLEVAELALTSGGRLQDLAPLTSLRAAGPDSKDVQMQAGNDDSDGSIRVDGDDQIEFRAGAGFFSFVDGNTGIQVANLNSLGNLQLDGDLTLSGNNIFFGNSGSIDSTATDVRIRAAGLDTDDLFLEAGNDLSDGRILIRGDSLMELRAGDGTFSFFDGSTGQERAHLGPTGDLQIDGDLTALGNDIVLGNAGRIFNSFSDLQVLAGPGFESLLLEDGTASTGRISIKGNANLELRAHDGNFSFVHGSTGIETAHLGPTGDLQIDGNLTISGADILGRNVRLLMDDFSDVIIGDGASTVPDVDVEIGAGGLCVDDDGSCAPPLDGHIKAFVFDAAGHSDLAELYPSNEELQPGDVVVVDRDANGRVRKSTSPYQEGVISIVSTSPGVVLGSPTDEELEAVALDPEKGPNFGNLLVMPGSYPVALLGRVPVKVTDENGPIARGDYLTSSSVPGVAMRASRPGSVLGQALEAWDGSGSGKIEVRIMPGWHGGGDQARPGGSKTTGTEPAAAAGSDTQPMETTLTPQVFLSKEANGPGRFSVFRGGTETSVEAELFRVDTEGNVFSKGSLRPAAMDVAEYFPVSEEVEAGDVLVADREHTGFLSLGRVGGDAAVVGVVSGNPGVLLGSDLSRIARIEPGLVAELEDARGSGDVDEESRIWKQLEANFRRNHAPIALTGTVLAKVDAGYGSIKVGDLLTVSPTEGHAMRSDVPRPGTILGKALEPLEAGTGLIKVLVMLR